MESYANNNKSLIIDLHHDLAYYQKTGGIGQTSFGQLQNAVKLFFGSVFIEPSADSSLIQDVESVAQDIRRYSDLATHAGASFVAIENKADLARILGGMRQGVLIHIEGASMLVPENEHLLEEWYRQGLRSFGPLWNKDNAIGVAAASGKPQEGLSDFGKRVIHRASELGMMIDCSHLNEAGFYDVLDIAGPRMLVTHGNARALCPHPRNFTDQQVKHVAAAGGIIGVFFSGKYVRLDAPPTIDDVVAHIDHIVSLAGITSVALGTDFGGITSGLVKGLERLEDIRNLSEKLLAKGYGAGDIADIFSRNAERYLGGVLG